MRVTLTIIGMFFFILSAILINYSKVEPATFPAVSLCLCWFTSFTVAGLAMPDEWRED